MGGFSGRHWLAVVVVIACAGCMSRMTLTEGGERVQHVTEADKPEGCQFVDDVSVGIPPDASRAPTEEEFAILMRNKAAGLGGNTLIIDSREAHNEDDPENTYFTGRGRVYRCPQEGEQTSGSEIAEEPIEGLEEDEDLEEGDGEGEDEEEEPGGLSDEDLLDL
jgi:hypothetical protein